MSNIPTASIVGGSNLIDAFLIIINIVNLFALFTHLHPVESPLKKPLLNATFQVVSKVHSTPFIVSATLATLLSISTCACIKYNLSSDQAMLIRAIVSVYTFACTSIFVKLSNCMIKLSVGRMIDMEKEMACHDIQTFQPPSQSVVNALLLPSKALFDIDSTGLERIPKNAPHLYVSNHSLYGLEMPLFLNHLYQEKGIFPRGLADHIHFATPNGSVLRAFGAVDGTRENVDTLMESGQDVLVYPGGGHEVLKHSSVPRYELMWKERVGFARCAIKHRYPVIPCACVGTEDMFDSIGDVPTGYKGLVIPISVTTPGRMQKIYFWFGHPISTNQYNGEYSNDDYAREVRDKIKSAIEDGIRELQEKQKNDPGRYLVDQYASKIRQYFCSTSKVVHSDMGQQADNSGEKERLKTK